MWISELLTDCVCSIDCCDGSDEYESGIHCQNTCRNIKYIAEAADGGSDLSVTHLDANTNEFMGKHAIAMEDHIQNNNSKDLVQKIRGTGHYYVRFTCCCYRNTIRVLDVVSIFT